MAWYIDGARYSGGRYHISGQEMPYCTKSGSKRDLQSTSSSYVYALGTILCYVTQSVLATFQASSEWESLKPSILGVVPNDYTRQYDRGGSCPLCWDLKTGVVPEPLPSDDPCTDVSCPDTCVGVEKYNQVCQDGICVRGTLIETNSVHCGYTPEPTPDPTPDPTTTNTIYILVAIALVGAYMILRR